MIALTENVNVTMAARRFAELSGLTPNHVLKTVADIDQGDQRLLAEVGERIEARVAEKQAKRSLGVFIVVDRAGDL